MYPSYQFPIVVALALFTFGPPGRAEEPTQSARRDAQKKIAERVDALARRLSAAGDAMAYQRLPASAEQKAFGDLADALRGLSETEIRQVLGRLDAAAKAPDAATADGEMRAAFADQRRVVSQLRAMASRLDPVRGADDAANKFDRLADRQLALVAGLKAAIPPKPDESLAAHLREHWAAEQADLANEVAAVQKQLGELFRFLAPDEKARLEKADVLARGTKLAAEMTRTVQSLRAGTVGDALDRQRRHAADLKDIASGCRGPNANRFLAVEAAQTVIEAVVRAGASRPTAEAHAIDPKDRRPSVVFLPEAVRDPGLKLDAPTGRIDPRDFEWDMPLTTDGRIVVAYHARSEAGVSEVNIAYRIIPKGDRPTAGRIVHPRDDPNYTTFNRLPLKKRVADGTTGAFVRDLGLFERSRKSDAVELFVLPAAKPAKEPVVTEAGGRVNFEVAGLERKTADGKSAKLEVGDAVELYVEVLDGDKSRAGYTRAKRKTVVSEYEARDALVRQISDRKPADLLRDLADDQVRVFVP